LARYQSLSWKIFSLGILEELGYCLLALDFVGKSGATLELDSLYEPVFPVWILEGSLLSSGALKFPAEVSKV
jgi:hypothetical protein